MKYYQVFISAEDLGQAQKIIDVLLERKLIFGGPVWNGPARFWWKGEVCNMDYSYIFSYTREDLKEEMMRVAEDASEEDVCMISVTEFEANTKLKELLDDTFDSD